MCLEYVPLSITNSGNLGSTLNMDPHLHRDYENWNFNAFLRSNKVCYQTGRPKWQISVLVPGLDSLFHQSINVLFSLLPVGSMSMHNWGDVNYHYGFSWRSNPPSCCSQRGQMRPAVKGFPLPGNCQSLVVSMSL